VLNRQDPTRYGRAYNVIEAAAKAGIRSVVCLGTDKAVYPVNAMV
jgi:UDP-N-acetylglucosamine 4,6-dehydratase